MNKLQFQGRRILTISLQSDLFDEFIAICQQHKFNRSAVVSSYIARFVKNERKSVNRKQPKREGEETELHS